MNLKPELSQKNKYWIDKHRYYELKHFCLQYKSLKKSYEAFNELGLTTMHIDRFPKSNIPADLTAIYAIKKAEYGAKIKLIENAAVEADKDLYVYILKAVTEGLSYNYLKSRLEIPCSRDTYYDRYRRFFWILSESRN